jgi:hypothetical protein
VVERGVPFFQRTHSKNDRDSAALRPKRVAGRGNRPFAPGG